MGRRPDTRKRLSQRMSVKCPGRGPINVAFALAANLVGLG
jgi:hypothetical protein